jgi:hypothetical protein
MSVPYGPPIRIPLPTLRYRERSTLWHGTWLLPDHGQIRSAMLTPMTSYLKLKRQAMRLMLTGDVERYMRTLRALNELRLLQRRGIA